VNGLPQVYDFGHGMRVSMVLERHILIHCYVVLPDFTRQLVPKDGKRPHKYCEENAKRNRFAEVLIVQI